MLIYVEKPLEEIRVEKPIGGPLEEIRVEKPIGDHQFVFQPLERNRETLLRGTILLENNTS